jgi:hypothetical protein
MTIKRLGITGRRRKKADDLLRQDLVHRRSPDAHDKPSEAAKERAKERAAKLEMEERQETLHIGGSWLDSMLWRYEKGTFHDLDLIQRKQLIARELIAEYEEKFPDDIPAWFEQLTTMANWQPGDKW